MPFGCGSISDLGSRLYWTQLIAVSPMPFGCGSISDCTDYNTLILRKTSAFQVKPPIFGYRRSLQAWAHRTVTVVEVAVSKHLLDQVEPPDANASGRV